MEITGNLVKHINNIYMRIINLYSEYNSYIMTMNTYILHKIGLDTEFDFKSPISEVDVTTIKLGSTNTTNSLWPLTR